jgi:hypothetical protein
MSRAASSCLRDSRGEVVRSGWTKKPCVKSPRQTRGAYFPREQLGEGLRPGMQLALEELSNGAGAGPGRKLGIDRFHYPVAAVLLLLAAESLLGTRRTPPR